MGVIDHDPFEDLDPSQLARRPGQKWHRHPGRLAAWVADMDFAPAPVVLEALRSVIDTGDLGYPDWLYPHDGTPMAALFVDRMYRRYGWTIDLDECREYVDVTQAVRLVIQQMTDEGDGLILHTPAYPPFHETWRSMNRRLVEVKAHPTDDGWRYDYDALEHRLHTEPGLAKVWILCHPQNPTGHVFEHAELQRIAGIAERFDLLVISDEIHSELVYLPLTHVPFASLSADVAARTVTITSVSKSFNLAGLRWAIAHVGPAAVRASLDALPEHLTGVGNVMAVAAATAAWTRGDDWQRACLEVLERRRHELRDLLLAHLPGVRYRIPQATYLAWLDCRGLGFDEEPVEVFRRRGVELNPGPDFGSDGHGFVRLNFATSRRVLEQVVRAMSGEGSMR